MLVWGLTFCTPKRGLFFVGPLNLHATRPSFGVKLLGSGFDGGEAHRSWGGLWRNHPKTRDLRLPCPSVGSCAERFCVGSHDSSALVLWKSGRAQRFEPSSVWGLIGITIGAFWAVE